MSSMPKGHRLGREGGKRKKAVSGIIAAMFLFAMLFTTGVGYFAFVQYNQQLQQIAARERANMETEQNLENFLVSGSASGSALTVYVTNNGPVPMRVVGVFVNDTFYDEDGGIGLPITVNSGSSVAITGLTYPGGTIIIKVVSERGNVVSDRYPLPVSGISLLASAVGPVVTQFSDFSWTSVTGGWLGNDPDTLVWYPGWNIEKNAPNVVWKVSVINHDNRAIQLDIHSVLWVITHESASNQAWFLVNTDASGNLVGYGGASAIVIPANEYYPNPNDPSTAVTLYFAAKSPGGTDTAKMNTGDIYSVFITLSGNYTDNWSRYGQTLLPIHSIFTY